MTHHTSESGGPIIHVETYIKNVICGSIWCIMKNVWITSSALAIILGVTWGQITAARITVWEFMPNNKVMTALECSKRKDFVRHKLDVFVFEFLLDDDYTRLDSKQGPIVIICPKTNKNITAVHKNCWIMWTRLSSTYSLCPSFMPHFN